MLSHQDIYTVSCISPQIHINCKGNIVILLRRNLADTTLIKYSKLTPLVIVQIGIMHYFIRCTEGNTALLL